MGLEHNKQNGDSGELLAAPSATALAHECLQRTQKSSESLLTRPPSLDMSPGFPCYGAELYNNFLGNDDRTWVTAGTVAALKLKNPWAAGAALVVWTGINAFQAGSACAVSSRAVYQ